MNRAKLAALLLVSVVASASVVYQVKNRRPAQGIVVGSRPEPKSATASLSATTATGIPAPPPPVLPANPSDISRTEQIAGSLSQSPPGVWGRNPFLTMEEWTKLNQPEQPVVIERPAEKPPQIEPPILPIYAVTGIISGSQGKWAIVDGRLTRPGERIGSEILKEIKDRGVVLEREGKMRELPLKRLEDTGAVTPPKKEEKKQ